MLHRNNPGDPGYPNQLAGQRDPREMTAYAPWHNGMGYGLEPEEQNDLFNPLTLLSYLVRYRWLIAIVLAVGAVIGTVFTWMQTPLYRATTRMEILVPAAKIFQDFEVISEASELRNFQTVREKLITRSLAQRVVFELGLADDPMFLFPAPQFGLSNLIDRAFGGSANENLADHTPEARENIAISRVRSGLSVTQIKGTNLLAVSFTSAEPSYASRVANQVAASFINQRVDSKSETSDLARQFIQEQVVQVKERLQSSERALVDYAKNEGITLTGSEVSLIASNIEAINGALSEAIQQRLDFGRTVKQIDAGLGASLPVVLESDGIGGLRERVSQLNAEYQQKLQTFKPAFPEMQQIRAQVAELEKQIANAIEVITGGIRMKYDEAKEKEEDLRQELAGLEAEQAKYLDKNIQYTILKREVDSNRAQYDSLIGKLNELGVGSELRQQSTAVVDAATTPRSPFSPSLRNNLAIALALAMGVAAVLIYIFELLNNTFSSPDQLESELKVPVLGVLPRVEEDKILDQLGDQKSGLSEAYRSLRTSLQFTGSEGSPRSVLVTSSEPSEGKSTTAFRMAQDFGALGMQVLLIDADMRKPYLHYFFGTDNTIGLSNLLTNTARKEDWKRLFRRTRYGNVTLLTAGTIPPNPADLLSSPKMTMLYQACISRYDIVIIDSPPVMGLSDAPILARLVEGVLLVVSANQVSRKSASSALKRIKNVGGHLLGTTLSKFSTRKFEYGYDYQYASSYQYHYAEDSAEPINRIEEGHDSSQKPRENKRSAWYRAGRFLRGSADGV